MVMRGMKRLTVARTGALWRLAGSSEIGRAEETAARRVIAMAAKDFILT